MRKTVLIAGFLLVGLIIIANPSRVHAEENNPAEMPTENSVMVEVVKGDSLSKIAKNHQTTYVRLFNANEIVKDPDIIMPGQKLRIPKVNEQLPDRISSYKQNDNIQTKVATPKTIKRQPKRTIKAQNRALKKPAPSINNSSVWDKLAACESGGNWSINTGNGYYGGVQFSAATWRAVGGQGLPHQNSKEEQIYRAQILQTRSGWGQWPACSKKLGLR